MVLVVQRITTATRSINKFGVGKDGFEGSVPGPPTQLEAAWYDNVQEELANVIEGQGYALDGLTLNQLSFALNNFVFSGTPVFVGAVEMQTSLDVFGPIAATHTSHAITGTSSSVVDSGVQGINSSSGVGVSGASTTGVGGVFSGGGASRGASCLGGPTGDGVRGLGGATSGHGVVGDSQGANSDGVRGTGADQATSHGVKGIATNKDAYGVYGTSVAAANAAGAGVRAEGLGSAPALSAVAVDGNAARLESDTSSPSRAPLVVVPQDADASTTQVGSLAMNSSRGNVWRFYNGTEYRSAHGSPNGHVFAYGTVADGANVATTGDVADATIVSEATGVVIVTVTGFWNGRTDTTEMTILLKDITGGVTVATSQPLNSLDIDSAVVTDRMLPFTFRKPYTLPSAGSRLFRARLNFSATVDWYDVVLTVQGVY